MLTGHISDDDLDLYATKRFYALPDFRSIEEHLVLCPVCQQRLEAVKDLIEALRATAR